MFLAVGVVAYKWMADVLEVDADLVGAAGVEGGFDQCALVKALDEFPTGPGFAAAKAFARGHAFAVGGVARDRNLDFAGLGARFAADDGAVGFFGAALFELGGEVQVGFVGFGDDDAAAGVHVEAMDDARPRDAGDAAELALAMMEEGVHKRPPVVAGRGVDNEARGFVDDNDVLVFEEDVERDVFGLGAGGNRFGPMDFDDIPSAGGMGRFDDSAVHADVPLLDHALEDAAADLGELVFKVEVEALHGQRLLHHDGIVARSHVMPRSLWEWGAFGWKATTRVRRRSRG